jgi:hypothetical protein
LSDRLSSPRARLDARVAEVIRIEAIWQSNRWTCMPLRRRRCVSGRPNRSSMLGKIGVRGAALDLKRRLPKGLTSADR